MTRHICGFLQSAIILLAALFITILGAESVLRYVLKRDPLTVSMGKPHPIYHHALEPNSQFQLRSYVLGEYETSVSINGLGFRGPEFEIEKRAGQIRILVLGDSFTFGVGLNDDETIPYLMQQQLDPSQDKVQVINAGVGSYSPLLYYLRLRDVIGELKPDVVIMMLDFTDLWDDWNYERNLVRNNEGDIIGVNPDYENGHFSYWNFLRYRTSLCQYLHNKVVRTVQKIRNLGLVGYLKAKLSGKNAKSVIVDSKSDTIAFDGRLFLRGKEKEREIRTHFKRTAEYIRLNQAVANSHGALFVLAMYPYGIHIAPHQWREGRTTWGFKGNVVYDDPFPFELVRDFAGENGIPFINMLDDFRKHSVARLFYDHDGHFTPRGALVAAVSLSNSAVILEQLK